MKKNILISILSLALLVILYFVSVYGFGSLQRGTADFRGETGQIEKTKANSSYRIASYEHFYDLCAGVQSIEGKIKNMEEELSGEDKGQRETVLKTSITASKNKRAEMISKYNGDARKEATSGQFKSSDLPYELNVEGEKTSCEAY